MVNVFFDLDLTYKCEMHHLGQRLSLGFCDFLSILFAGLESCTVGDIAVALEGLPAEVCFVNYVGEVSEGGRGFHLQTRRLLRVNQQSSCRPGREKDVS